MYRDTEPISDNVAKEQGQDPVYSTKPMNHDLSKWDA